MDLISLIKSNTRVRFDERSESGFSPCGRDRPKGDSEVAVDEESAPKGEQKKAKGAQAPLESRNHGRFSGVSRILVAELFGAKWEPCIPFRLGKF